jgi:four helix bundle protein
LFALRIIQLVQYLQIEKKEYVLSKQILKSGTSIGALIREAEFGQSKKDFINKLSISLKEANETEYWLNLLHDSKYIDKDLYLSLQSDCKELIAMLVSSIKTSKQ